MLTLSGAFPYFDHQHTAAMWRQRLEVDYQMQQPRQPEPYPINIPAQLLIFWIFALGKSIIKMPKDEIHKNDQILGELVETN